MNEEYISYPEVEKFIKNTLPKNMVFYNQLRKEEGYYVFNDCIMPEKKSTINTTAFSVRSIDFTDFIRICVVELELPSEFADYCIKSMEEKKKINQLKVYAHA